MPVGNDNRKLQISPAAGVPRAVKANPRNAPAALVPKVAPAPGAGVMVPASVKTRPFVFTTANRAPSATATNPTPGASALIAPANAALISASVSTTPSTVTLKMRVSATPPNTAAGKVSWTVHVSPAAAAPPKDNVAAAAMSNRPLGTMAMLPPIGCPLALLTVRTFAFAMAENPAGAAPLMTAASPAAISASVSTEPSASLTT